MKKHGGKVRMSQCDIRTQPHSNQNVSATKWKWGMSCYLVPEMRSLPSTPHEAVTHSRQYWGSKLHRAPLDEFMRVWELYICSRDIYCLFIMLACLIWNKPGGTITQIASSSTPQCCLRRKIGRHSGRTYHFFPCEWENFNCFLIGEVPSWWRWRRGGSRKKRLWKV